MTLNERQNYNQMLEALKKIAAFDTPEQLERNSEGEYGLEYEEALELAYGNIRQIAISATGGISPMAMSVKKRKRK